MENNPVALHISPELDLPLDFITDKVAIVGVTGSGKTNTAVVMAEEILRAGQQVVILDKLGVWYGLRSSKDGENAGLPIPIFGGLAPGSLPLPARSGALIAQVIVERGIPAILDLSDLKLGEQRQFVADFSDALFDAKRPEAMRDPIHIMVDEAQVFAPQQLMDKGTEMVSLSALIRLTTQGRVRGIGLTFITQRPQAVSKSVLSQVEVMIALRLSSPQERKALADWFGDQADEETRKKALAALPSLETGVAVVASAHTLKRFETVHIRERDTFDSSATPKVGQERREPREFAAVDMEALRERIAAVDEENAATNPAALKAELERLKKLLAGRPAASAPQTVEIRVPVSALSQNQIDDFRARVQVMMETAADLVETAALLTEAMEGVAVLPDVETAPVHTDADAPVDVKATAARPSAVSPDAPPTILPLPSAALAVTGPQQAILDTVSFLNRLGIGTPTKQHIGQDVGKAASTKSFANDLRALRSGGLIEYVRGEGVRLTDSGRGAAASWSDIDSLADLHGRWLNYLSAPQEELLRNVLSRHPDVVSRDALAAFVGKATSTKSFVNDLGRLKSYGLVDYIRGVGVAAGSILFPEGLK